MLGVEIGPAASVLHGWGGGPGLRLGFVDGRFERDGRRFAALDGVPGVGFARVGEGLAVEVDGRWRRFASGAPRLTGQGLLIEGQRTNKLATANAAPVDLTGVTRSGDAAATLAVEDDAAALRAAGFGDLIDAGVMNGRVFRLDNRAGTTPAQVRFVGPVGELIDHAASVVWRGSGMARYGTTQSFGTSEALPTAYERRWKTATGLSTTSRTFGLEASPGAEVRFLLMQVEPGTHPTSAIVTRDAAATRGADVLTVDLAEAADWTMGGETILDVGGREQALVDLSDAGGARRLTLRRLAEGTLVARLHDGGATTTLGAAAKTGARIVRWAVGRTGSSWTFAADGALAGTAGLATPAPRRARLGALSDGAAPLDGWMRRWRFEPGARTAEELMERTA